MAGLVPAIHVGTLRQYYRELRMAPVDARLKAGHDAESARHVFSSLRLISVTVGGPAVVESRASRRRDSEFASRVTPFAAAPSMGAEAGPSLPLPAPC